MPPDDKQEKPMPSAAEINAYLELSAARTKKRLTLAAGNAVPMKAPGKVARKALFTGAASPGRAVAVPLGVPLAVPLGVPLAEAQAAGAPPGATHPAASPGGASPGGASPGGASPDAESTWRPFPRDDES